MRGGNHFVMNAVSAFTLVDAYLLITKTAAAPSLKPAAEAAVTWMSTFGSMPMPIGIVLSMLGYMAGALLPDIDSPHSPFGKHFYVDVPHRTWTHSFWFVLLFAISSYWFRPLIWLALGTFFHIFWDSFSVSGIHWFYPWHKDKGHLLQLYRTGETSEKVVMILGVAFAVLLSGFTVWQMTRSQVDVWMRLS